MERLNLTAFFLFTLLLSTALYASSPAHFYLQMENRSEKTTILRFEPNEKNSQTAVYLIPALNNNTPLAAHEKSPQYGVHIEPLTAQATFDIIFTGKQDCHFTVGYYGPGNPKVSVAGPGCLGGGYQLIDKGRTLLLYISDIRRNK
ncbi:hypothetical protein [Aquicella lusitana]|uniref:Uncharacterized protein n=1 Tax=Aquicella lusitana TaxID=254246 RepID=A0A370GNU8_9COXI|nr:hypothetical protein [Aquicella lusitana]RDI45191.1 hypothetical protein C8D86_10770 [Aquicella lusitana]VVC72739.1 hypothetical protein AQULUS_04600 [Aquicella lusitana]